jgi:hypothetical protein
VGYLDDDSDLDVAVANLESNDVSVLLSDGDGAFVGIAVGAISRDTGEDGTQAVFTVRLTSKPTDDVTIDVSSSDPTEGTVDPSSLTFTTGNWNANQEVTVTGEDDDVIDGDQSYTIELAPATSGDPDYDGLDPADVTLTNIDDEEAGFTVSAISGDTGEDGTTASFTVRLSGPPTDDVTIDVSSLDATEGTVNPSSLTFTPDNWEADQTVTVTGVDDFVDDGDQGYTIELALATSVDPNYDGLDPDDVTVINIDDETAGFTVSAISGDTGEDGTKASFTVQLTSEPLNDVTIGVSSLDPTEGTVDTSSLTFTALNWDAGQPVTVTGVDDAVIDGDQSYTIRLAPATSGDPNYNMLDPDDVAVTNIDDESAGFTVSAISGNTGEDGTQAIFTVRLTGPPTEDVTIGVSSLDPTEGTVNKASLTFTAVNWDADQKVTVTGANDFVADGNQSYTIDLASAASVDPNYDGLDPTDVTVTNIDDETAGFTVSAISGDTGENGTTAAFTVRLTSQPTNDVTIGVSSLDTTEGAVNKSSLTFTAVNWDADQKVTVAGADDFVADGNQSYTIRLAPANSVDPNYDGLDPTDVTVTNIDDETAGFTVSAISGDTGEDGTTAVFTVRLTSQPTNDVTIGVSSLDTTEGTVDKSSLIFTAGNWNANQTVTVIGVDDFVADGNQSYTIELAPAISGDPDYDGLDPADVAVTNKNVEGSLRAKLEAFVTRFYQLCLDRTPDPVGLNGWVMALLNGTQTGGSVANGFVFSPEFQDKVISNGEYLEILYEAFFNRQPDAAGLQAWLIAMANGTSREDVLNGFIYATEFVELCEEYGIKAFEGHIPKASREAVEAFVTRFYQLCLDRNPDAAGLEEWTNNLLNQIQTGADVANGFIYSQEFINKNTTNEEYLNTLYNAFFNRDPDQVGWDAWIAELNAGKDRGYVLDGFLYSQEFFNMCEDYGITPN